MGPSANPSADGPAPVDELGSGAGDASCERLGRGCGLSQVCRAIRIGMRRLVVAHSDEQGSASS